MVKEELGPKAVILKTQKTNESSFLGFLGKGKVEVTAALDEGLFVKPKGPAGEAENKKNAVRELMTYNQKGLAALPQEPSPKLESNFSDEKFRLAEIHQDVEEVKTVLRGLADHIRHENMPPLPDQIANLCARLIDQEVSKENAIQIALKLQGMLGEKDAANPAIITEKAEQILASSITAAGPFTIKESRASRIMFVGPTGGGKTTTIAKLAAQYGILQRRRVRMITADTYRIAAVEQLKTFAEISDIPMEVVFTPEEMRRAVTRMSPSADLILIDTAGRSQHNEEHMNDVRELTQAAEPDELHLVLASNLKESDMRDVANRFRLLGINRYLFTKLDETSRYGSMYNLMRENKVPFSYFTTGQSVPDDIEEGGTLSFARRILESSREKKE